MKPRCYLALTIAAFCLGGCKPKTPVPVDSPLSDAQVRQLIHDEVAKALSGTGETQREVEKLVLARVAKDLEQADLQKTLQSRDLLQAAQYGRQKITNSNDIKRVDLTGITSVEGKIRRLTDELADLNSYGGGCAVEAQLAELGVQAKTQLMEKYRELSSGEGSNFGARLALGHVLESMLTEDDQDFILEDMKAKNPELSDLAIKMNLTEAGPIAVKTIQEMAGKNGAWINASLLEIAMYFQPEAAVPIIRERLASGQNGAGYLAQTLNEKFPNVDIRQELPLAASKAETPAERYSLASIMIEKGVPEGLPLIAEALTGTGVDGVTDYMREEIRKVLRNHLSVTGSDQDIGQWLKENQGSLRWNPGTKMFEEIPADQ